MASTALVTDQRTIPTGTASTTPALGPEQATPQADRASLSAAAPQPLATASSNNLNAPASQSYSKMPQSQPSSQQSFAATKPSSSQGLRQASLSDSQSRMGPPQSQHADSGSGIYSVSPSGL